MVTVSRERVPILTGLLSVVSLVVVFSAAGGQIPQTVVPKAPDWVLDTIPHLNALISLAAIGVIVRGWRAIRSDDVDSHRRAMMLAFVLFVLFLIFYLYRLIAMGGPTSFPGPETIERFLYLPVLALHILLAVITLPLLYYVLLLAASHPVTELGRTRHPSIGRIAATLWIVSFGLGIVVYGLLYHLY